MAFNTGIQNSIMAPFVGVVYLGRAHLYAFRHPFPSHDGLFKLNQFHPPYLYLPTHWASSGCSNLVQALQAAQAERQTLAATSYPDETCDGTVLAFLFDAQIRQCVLACDSKSASALLNCRWNDSDLPNTLLA